ncbi:hypothetical protein MELA_01425 [Candidatus Methylomirabilis lanthanidiphila]|uniref:FG-GAP repeat protein n=1 Tax=Candidatus Methylomirabilis lanthanidiphila TaxID=2211376 RepID=A0A564ZI71_9BACT|nr:VCBS repeat-containing protein [Candidatus Methylomirabilis lanthanidiphila]VUZ85050.1 hypothetical protein MELA_01425 [Candidatus Methylomirabilis lanthanidiphila]
MGCKRSVSLVLTSRIAFLVVLLSSLSIIASPTGTALGEERPPVRGGSVSSARDRQGGPAEAARAVAEQLAAAFARVTGLIIGFEGDLVLIDRGTADGVVQGMELNVFREGEEFKHPLTGEILGRLDKDLGTLRVLHVRERYAETTVIKKAEKAAFRKGDRVRVSMARMIVAFPNVDAVGVGGVGARSITKDLAAALVRTGRFELIDERQLRSMLSADKELKATELATPGILTQLAEKGKIQILLLSRLTPSTDGVSLDVQAYSTLTGHSIVLASALVQLGAMTPDRLSRGLQPPSTGRSAVMTPPQTRAPAIAPPPPSKRAPIAPIVAESSEPVVLEPAIDGFLTAMGVADLDGDGKSELLAAGADRLQAFRFEGSRLKLLAEYPLGGKDIVTTLEAMDVTGDGGAEIIMTLSRDRHVRAIVLQWVNGKFRSISERPDLVLRPLSPDGKSVRLFGQAMTPGDRAAQPIHHHTWDGQNLHAGPALDVPSGFSLLELTIADLNGDGAMRLLTFRGGGTLEVGSQTGALISRYKVGEEATVSKNRVDPRILIDKERDEGKPQIIVARDREAEGRPMLWWSGSKTAGLTVLKWDGTQFHEVRQAPVADGVLADYAVADLGEGLGRRLLALIVKSGRLGWGTKSEIQAFRIR